MAEEKKTKKRASSKKKSEPIESVATEKVTEESVKTAAHKMRPSDDRVTCIVCGRTAPRATSTKVSENEYVCSSRCLSRYGQTHRQHAHR